MVNIQENVGVFAIQFIIANGERTLQWVSGSYQNREEDARRAQVPRSFLKPGTCLPWLRSPEQLEASASRLVDGHFEPKAWRKEVFVESPLLLRTEGRTSIHPGFARHHRNAAREGLGVVNPAWRARASSIPWPKEPTHPEGWPSSASTPITARRDFQPDGSPVLVWRRNEAAGENRRSAHPYRPNTRPAHRRRQARIRPCRPCYGTPPKPASSRRFSFHASPCSPDRLRLVSDPRPSP